MVAERNLRSVVLVKAYVDRIMQYEITDAVHLSDDEKSEQVAAKTIWQPEIECKLL